MFENQPRLSVRAAASNLQISHTTVHRILRRRLFVLIETNKISMAFAAATNLSAYNLHETVEITPVDIRNASKGFSSPRNLFFVSMVQ